MSSSVVALLSPRASRLPGSTLPLLPQLMEMLDKPSPSRSDARKKRKAVGRAAPMRKDTRWLLSLPPSPMLVVASPNSNCNDNASHVLYLWPCEPLDLQ